MESLLQWQVLWWLLSSIYDMHSAPFATGTIIAHIVLPTAYRTWLKNGTCTVSVSHGLLWYISNLIFVNVLLIVFFSRNIHLTHLHAVIAHLCSSFHVTGRAQRIHRRQCVGSGHIQGDVRDKAHISQNADGNSSQCEVTFWTSLLNQPSVCLAALNCRSSKFPQWHQRRALLLPYEPKMEKYSITTSCQWQHKMMMIDKCPKSQFTARYGANCYNIRNCEWVILDTTYNFMHE